MGFLQVDQPYFCFTFRASAEILFKERDLQSASESLKIPRLDSLLLFSEPFPGAALLLAHTFWWPSPGSALVFCSSYLFVWFFTLGFLKQTAQISLLRYKTQFFQNWIVIFPSLPFTSQKPSPSSVFFISLGVTINHIVFELRNLGFTLISACFYATLPLRQQGLLVLSLGYLSNESFFSCSLCHGLLSRLWDSFCWQSNLSMIGILCPRTLAPKPPSPTSEI